MKSKFITISIILLQLISSCALLYLVYRYLTTNLFLIIGIVLLALLVLLGMISNSKKGSKRYIAKVLSIILSICMIIACIPLYQANKTIDEMTGVNYEIGTISVIVLKDSEIQSLNDLEGKIIGINPLVETENIDNALIQLKEEVSYNLEKYESFETLISKLYDGSCDAIMICESSRSVAESFRYNFTNETRVVSNYTFKEDIVGSVIEVEDEKGNTNSIQLLQPVDVTKETFNVFISGIDTSGPIGTRSRSDVNMIATVNPKTKQILLTSIPRDAYCVLGTIGQLDKLTHAGNFGINESVATVAKLFNINIHYYLRVNFTSVVQIIDAVGGVDVYSDQELFGKIQIGMNHMDGNTALMFARERYSYSTGDAHRVQNQQAVFEALINKCVSPAIISNFTSFLQAINGTFQTNMSSDQINALVQMQLGDMSRWNIHKQQMYGQGSTSTTTYSMPGSNLYVTIPIPDSVQACKQAIEALY